LPVAHLVPQRLDDVDGLLDAVARVGEVVPAELDARDAVERERLPLPVAHPLPTFERLSVLPDCLRLLAEERERLGDLVEGDGLPAAVLEVRRALNRERALVDFQSLSRVARGDVGHPRANQRVCLEAPVA
jgi:hypothetical protein